MEFGVHCLTTLCNPGWDTMSAEENKAIVRRFFEAVRDGDHAVIDELVSEDYVRHVPNETEPKRGRE